LCFPIGFKLSIVGRFPHIFTSFRTKKYFLPIQQLIGVQAP
jgi:hypothetical protein